MPQVFIRDGYKIPFIIFPPPKVSPNNGSALKEKEFFSEAICNLVGNKCLEVLNHPPAIVNPHSVSIQSLGKKRLMSTCTFSNKSLSVKICQWLLKLCPKDIIYLSLILNPGITMCKYFLTTENIWPLPGILETGS